MNLAEIFPSGEAYAKRLQTDLVGEFKRSASPVRAANDNATLPVVDLADWEGKPIVAREWFLPGLIPARNVTLLSGDGGTGKSLLALQLGLASVLGKDVLGMAPAQGRVLYLAAEDEADEFHRRSADIVRHYGVRFRDTGGRFRLLPLATQDATLMTPGAGNNMQPTPLMRALVDQIHAFEPDFIVLDTSADLFGGDEIKRNQVRQFVAMFRQIAIDRGCAILLLSHPSVSGMQTGTGTSGSTAWNNSVRSRLYLDRPEPSRDEVADPDIRRLSNKKANYGAVGESIALRWSDGVFVLDDGGGAGPAIGLMNAHADKVFLNVLSKMNRQGQNLGQSPGTSYAPAKMIQHPDAKGLTKKTLERAMQRLLDAGTIKIVEEGPPSKIRRRLAVTAECFGQD